MSRNLLRGASIVGSLTLLSRLLGFVRDLLVARIFGAGFYADAYLVAFRIPNLLRSLFAEGALTSAFVPTFATELQKGKEQAGEALKSIAGFLLLVTTIVSALGIFFAPQVVRAIAPGFAPHSDKSDLCVILTQIMMPYIIFVSLVALINGALNTVKIFGASAWAQVWMNLSLIVGALVAMTATSPAVGVRILAGSVIVGGIVQVVGQFPALKKAGLPIFPSIRVFSTPVLKTLALIAPAIFGATIYQVTMFLVTLLASLLEEGAVSWLFYADRLVQLPIGVFTIALASVLLPSLAIASGNNEKEGFNQNLTASLRWTSYVIMPITACLVVLARPMVALVFQRGAFDEISADNTALAVQAMAFGIWSSSCHSMIVRGFIARKDTITPAIIGTLSLIVTILSALMLVGPIRGEGSWMAIAAKNMQSLLPFLGAYGHTGIALASTFASLSAFLVLVTIFCYRNREFSLSPILKITVRAGGAAVVASVLTQNVLSYLNPSYSSLLQLIIGGTTLTLSYVLIGYCIGMREIPETFFLIRRIVLLSPFKRH